MHIFMTGATGFIGGVLLRQLVDEGHYVHVLYRPSSKDKIDRSLSRVEYVEGDLMNPASLERGMEECKQVYHLAGYARIWARDTGTFYRINTLGTRNVLRVALNQGIDKVVVTSSAATLPPSTNNKPVDETARSTGFKTDYALSKFLAEEEARLYSREGLHTVIVNPPRVYGPGLLSKSNAVTKLIKWYIEGKWHFLLGKQQIPGNYVFVEDVARGHRQAMERGKSGERYILGGENLSLQELFQLVTNITRKQRTLWSLPLPLVKTIGKVEQWKADHLHFSPLITPQWLDNYLEPSALSSRKAVTELNYEITPASKGIERTVRWIESTFLKKVR